MFKPPAARACILHLSALSSPSSANKFISASPPSGPNIFNPFGSVSQTFILSWYNSTAPSGTHTTEYSPVLGNNIRLPVVFISLAFEPSCAIVKSLSFPNLMEWLSSNDISKLLVSRSPPSCGEVSLTKSVARLVRPDPLPVAIPVKNISPSLLKVIPLPTTIPFLAVINPT